MNSFTTKFIFGVAILGIFVLILYIYAALAINIIAAFVLYLIISEILDRFERKGLALLTHTQYFF